LPSERRFPPPWTVAQQHACFIVRDANDQRNELDGEMVIDPEIPTQIPAGELGEGW
jgi:hypothetical protein